MAIYDINFGSEAEKIAPPEERKESHLAWFRALLKPLQELRDQIFNIYKPDVTERAKYNSQTMVLEAILNKHFNITVSPFIYIQNNTLDTNGFFVGVDGADNATIGVDNYIDDYIGTVYSYGTSNFTVFVPVALSINQDELNSVVNDYKIYGINHDVQTY